MSASSEIGITPNSLKRHDKLFLIFSLRYMTLHFPNVELNCVKTGGRYIYIHIIEEKKTNGIFWFYLQITLSVLQDAGHLNT